MSAKRLVNSIIGSFVIGFATISTALAADSGYQTIYWMQGTSAAEVEFVLNDDTAIYYKCNDVDIVEHCRAILLTALSTAREVKAYYSTGTGASGSPFIVTAVRIH